MREIRFFRTRSGHSPVEEFLDPLAAKQAQKVVWTLRLVDEVPVQYLTGIEDLWEVRVRHGGDAIRLLCFFDGPRLLVVTSGFAKKSRRTPPQEIARAEKRRRDHLSRNGEDE